MCCIELGKRKFLRPSATHTAPTAAHLPERLRYPSFTYVIRSTLPVCPAGAESGQPQNTGNPFVIHSPPPPIGLTVRSRGSDTEGEANEFYRCLRSAHFNLISCPNRNPSPGSVLPASMCDMCVCVCVSCELSPSERHFTAIK